MVDSGAIECVASRERVASLRVEATPQSMRGEIWTCAGEKRSRRKAKSHGRLDDGIMYVEKVECPRHGRCPAHGSVLTDCWKHDMM